MAVVNPLPQNSWVSDTALYSVSGSQAVSTGSLFVGSSAPGSMVYLNGRSVGGANVTYTNLQPGSYAVRVTTPNYSDYNANISIRAGWMMTRVAFRFVRASRLICAWIRAHR